jgi:hypothetical protein
VPVGQAEAARSIGLTFSQSLSEVLLPQAFRGAITPLGNTLIALTKNTTVATAIGVAEISGLMKEMMEFRAGPDHSSSSFSSRIGFVILTLPDRHPHDSPVDQVGGEAMTSVLFDHPGPKARARHRIIAGCQCRSWSSSAAVVGAGAVQGEGQPRRGQVDPVPHG